MGEENGDDRVGYGRPPKAHQFKKGQSGNPAGRPKGARGFKTIASEILAEPVRVRGPEGQVEMSSGEAMLRMIMKKALQGDLKCVELAQRPTADIDHQTRIADTMPLSQREVALYERLMEDEDD